MGVIDDDIRPHNSRDRMCEIKREREGKKLQPTEKERERERERERAGNIFHLRFDSATFSFLALLVIKSYGKTESAKLKKGFHISQ